jgi:hypothetical protein
MVRLWGSSDVTHGISGIILRLAIGDSSRRNSYLLMVPKCKSVRRKAVGINVGVNDNNNESVNMLERLSS